MNPIVMLELVRESLVAVVDEMRANVIRSSYSSIIYEGHDFSCALLTARLPGTPCAGAGFESGCSTCEHPDGTQWYGAIDSTIQNSTFTNINPGGTTAQGIFFAAANGGTYSNLTFSNNTLGPTANNARPLIVAPLCIR